MWRTGAAAGPAPGHHLAMTRAGAGRLGVAVLAGALLLVGCGDDGGSDHNPGALFPERANQYAEDQEREIGAAARLGGYTTTVTGATVDGVGTVRVEVEVTNRDEGPQRVDGTQWTLVNPRVQTLEATGADFRSTELAGGETVRATVTFTVDPEEPGTYYIQYKPEALDAARGIWALEVD